MPSTTAAMPAPTSGMRYGVATSRCQVKDTVGAGPLAPSRAMSRTVRSSGARKLSSSSVPSTCSTLIHMSLTVGSGISWTPSVVEVTSSVQSARFSIRWTAASAIHPSASASRAVMRVTVCVGSAGVIVMSTTGSTIPATPGSMSTRGTSAGDDVAVTVSDVRQDVAERTPRTIEAVPSRMSRIPSTRRTTRPPVMLTMGTQETHVPDRPPGYLGRSRLGWLGAPERLSARLPLHGRHHPDG